MNITLIGMPGSGKSSIGARLADALGYTFIDPDTLLEERYTMPLQSVLESLGEEAFLKEEAALSVEFLKGSEKIVLATGGSIVYSEEAMEKIAQLSKVVYLKADLATIEKRIGEAPRGIVGLAGRSLSELYEERKPLYERYATVTVDASQSPDAVISAIRLQISKGV